ncbi:MAG: radical SAM protein [Alphaproteobacteria bacterium]
MVSVIVKPTLRCNAACAYCSSANAARSSRDRMPPAVLERLFDRVHEFLTERPRETVVITWHGGEPLLMGPGFFEDVLACQRRSCGTTASRIAHRLQTNLTLFGERFVAPLRRLGLFGIGTSYEPLPGLRGLGKARDCDAYRERFHEAVRLLEAERFGWGLIYVVTRPALDRAEEIFAELIRLKPDGNISLHAVDPGPDGAGDLAISPRQFADFLGTVFTTWWPRRERHPHVEPFRSLTRSILDGVPHLYCREAGTCAATHLGVEPDGTYSHCGRASDRQVLEYGSVFERSFAEVLADPRRVPIAGRQTTLRQGACRDCRLWSLCHGGCPLDAVDATGDFAAPSPWCEATKAFIEDHFEPITGTRYHGGKMPILIKHGDRYYEIPDEVLASSGLTREQFEQRLQKLGTDVADPARDRRDNCNFIDLAACRVEDF